MAKKPLKHFLTLFLFVILSHGLQAIGQVPDIYKTVFDSVDRQNLILQLKNMTGINPVSIGGQTFKIGNRYSSASKQNFRTYFTAYFQSLGFAVNELNYPTQHTDIEAEGHDVEAVLQGKSPDSIVIIVHYDSMGAPGAETQNPAVDDDMTGMAISLETARILAEHKGSLTQTVRFVASDFEEWRQPTLEGARYYAGYIKKLAAAQGFKIAGGIDNEQAGWNCANDGLCNDNSTGNVIDAFDCLSPFPTNNFPELGVNFTKVSQSYSTMKVKVGCVGPQSDFYTLWEIGVAAIVFGEHSPFNNPHYDEEGRDTFDLIDQDYFFKIAQIGVTYAAQLVGIEK